MIVFLCFQYATIILKMSDFKRIFMHIKDPATTRPNLIFKVGGTAVVVVRRRKRAAPLRRRLP
jgi:hypothetical protein